MAIELYFTFLAAVILLALTPGPLMALLISNSVSYGVQAGLRTLAGSILALSLLVCVIILGLTSIVQFMADWFYWVKMAGAAYLIWLGFTKIRSSDVNAPDLPDMDQHRRFFMHGFVVSLANPKVLLFLAAFFPQFISPAHDTNIQLVIYGISFVVGIAIIDLSYVLASGKTKSFLSRQRLAVFDKVSGVLLMLGGVVLLLSRRQ